MGEIKPNPAWKWVFLCNNCVLQPQQWNQKTNLDVAILLIKLMRVAACDKFKSQLISRIITMSQYLWRFMKILIDLHISAKICQDPSRSTKICQDLLRSAEIWWNMWRSGGICQDLLRSAKIYWDLMDYVKIWWDLSKYAMTKYILMILKSHSPFELRLMLQKSNGWWQSRCLSVKRQREIEWVYLCYLQRKKSLQDIWKRFVKHL